MYKMSSEKPYVIRAYYEWIVDNDCTPYLLVNATSLNLNVPAATINQGRIVFNISVESIDDFLIGDSSISFQSYFGGVAHAIEVPMYAVLAIYTKENGMGMFFPEEQEPPPEHKDDNKKDSPPPSRPHLTLVKD